MKLSLAVIIGAVGLVIPGATEAQGRSKGGEIPVASRPPAGMCRVWLDDVPAAQQPAPTDCATAVRNRPAKGRVIFGDDYVAPRRDSSKREVPIKGFVPSKSGDKKAKKGRTPIPLP